MAKLPVSFGDWRPDVALLDNQFASEAENVTVGLNSYKPFPGPERLTSTPLPGRVCGLTAARTITGAPWKIYAGTEDALYEYTASGTWNNISRTSGGPYHVGPEDLWTFEQSGP